MSWIKHDSSQLHSSNYDANEQSLRVRFHCKCKGADANCKACGGKGYASEYAYPNVDEAKYIAIRDAPSVGKAFAEHIKSKPGLHPHTRVY